MSREQQIQELKATAEKVASTRALLESRTKYRDRQLAQMASDGFTWREMQELADLSPRGLAMALKRARQA